MKFFFDFLRFTYKDVQEMEKQLYGENAELSSIHHLYARVALHSMAQQRGWMYPELLSRLPSFELLVAGKQFSVRVKML